MSVKNQVLSELLRSNNYISGEQLAKELEVSRNAIWKAIKKLQEEGYKIEASGKKGYRLTEELNIISEPSIKQYIRGSFIPSTIEIHKEIPSTNARAKVLAEGGAPHGAIIISDSQSMGRGRLGRSFFSPAGTGIYMSIVLRPELTSEEAPQLTSLAAVAVSEAIELLAKVPIKIKWVNDLFLNKKKICGILTEASLDFESGRINYIILGIGINVGRINFPEELKEIATSIENETSNTISKNQLIAEILNSLNRLLPEMKSGKYLEDVRKRSLVIGQSITVLKGSSTYTAKALAIDNKGALIVEGPKGIETLSSGEISIRL
ncbi:biotin--[acetyl-CoA-carboxylase] ligase [Alloiococcus sp. CFN-8]|uniref:biotin--[acetyl-CoA-carboxylase] ligase n=1 Tax=Alloiococcus sp. CFN-8 TaxID=3416081 RepID=UPI003CED7415